MRSFEEELQGYIWGLCQKDGYELFKKVEEILNGLGVRVYDESGLVARDLYAICCDVAEVLNKEK